MRFHLQIAKRCYFDFDRTRKCLVIVRPGEPGTRTDCGVSPAALIEVNPAIPGQLHVCEEHVRQLAKKGIVVIPYQPIELVPDV